MRSQFNIYDWINVYIEAEEILISKIEKCKVRIKDLNAQESQLESWLEAELHNLREQRKVEEKALWINLLDGEILEDQRKRAFLAPTYVLIKYGDQLYESGISENQFRPIWNQAFKMYFFYLCFYPLDYIEIRIINLYRMVNNIEKFFTLAIYDVQGNEYGSIKLSLAHFEDQRKRKEWIYLSDNTQEGVVVRLNLSIIFLRTNVIHNTEVADLI